MLVKGDPDRWLFKPWFDRRWLNTVITSAGVCYNERFTVHHSKKAVIGFMLDNESVIQTYKVPRW